MKVKKFFEDYKEECKNELRFYKEHWVGVTILTITASVILSAPTYVPMIKEKIDEHKQLKG
jgi:hypothetical protein